MRLSDLAKGLFVVLSVVAAGYVSTVYVDQYIPQQATTARPAPPACVDADGSWKNWPWPNVPALSPKCR